jgi:cell division protein FtsB
MSETIILVIVIAVMTAIPVLLLRRLDDKLDVVHTLVNSKMAAALTEIEELRAEVRLQKTQIRDLKEDT